MTEQPVFKKRSGANKGNLRKKLDDDDTDITQEIDKEYLSDIKLHQTMRMKRAGTTLDNLSRKKTSSEKTTSGVSKTETVETVLGSQFSLQTDSGFDGGLPHEKMMEKYIEDKLGLKQLETFVFNRFCSFSSLIFRFSGPPLKKFLQRKTNYIWFLTK